MKKIFLTILLIATSTFISSAFAANASNGKVLVEKGNCASCHGADLKSPVAPGYPKIAGQHADYLFYALKAYQVTGNPHIGRSNAIMGGQAKPFSKDELKDIAAYVSTLPGDLVLKK